MYGLMEAQPYALAMQNEIIGEVEQNAPQYVVWVAGDMSWLRRPQSPPRIFDWWQAYAPQHYRLVGIAEIVSAERTEYRWGAAAETYQPRSGYFLAVYRRREAGRPASRDTQVGALDSPTIPSTSRILPALTCAGKHANAE